MSVDVLLISTYEMGRQPFGLASPAAWLKEAGFNTRCLDLAVEPLDEAAVSQAGFIAFYVPMHMATRMAVALLPRARRLNPQAHICFYGLYAPENASYLRQQGVNSFLGGEFEAGLVALARRAMGDGRWTMDGGRWTADDGGWTAWSEPAAGADGGVSLARQQFLPPDRSGLPGLERYAQLDLGNGRRRLVGYVEASRGCKHTCRHCPIVPVYNGRFRIVQRDVVLADIAQQVEAGAQHITFGDPDFFNGPGHAMPIVRALHERFPDVTYDATIKVEHLQKHASLLPALRETGCLFVTTAVESFDDHILEIFRKNHTHADFERALAAGRQAGLLLIPTFVAFTPWTTLAGYRHFLSELLRLDLVNHAAPIQLTIRLLIPPGSHLLPLAGVQEMVAGLDEALFSYTWRNPDPRVDQLQQRLEKLVARANAQKQPRTEIFRQVWQAAHQIENLPAPELDLPPAPKPIPTLTEAWYC